MATDRGWASAARLGADARAESVGAPASVWLRSTAAIRCINAVSITETVPSTQLATKRLRLLGVMAIPVGSEPTGTLRPILGTPRRSTISTTCRVRRRRT
jgi:hypothetical protein